MANYSKYINIIVSSYTLIILYMYIMHASRVCGIWAFDCILAMSDVQCT